MTMNGKTKIILMKSKKRKKKQQQCMQFVTNNQNMKIHVKHVV